MSMDPALPRTFGRIGLLSFGGPAGQIALMHRILVDEKRWLSEAEFLRALSLCMLLPGPEAMQLATYAGWKRAGFMGGLVAGGLFVLPGAVLILLLAMLYQHWGQLPGVSGLLLGLKAAVVAILLQAVVKLSRRALPGRTERLIAVAAFVAIYVFAVPFPMILIGAALAGIALCRPAPVLPVPLPPGAFGRLAKTFAVGLALWFAPLAALWLAGQGFLLDIGLYFSRLAVVTFGGAYAVLGDMAQTMVTARGWVTAGAMMDALGLAETTPGPLILVTEFTAYLAGAAQGGTALAVAAALLCLWVSFVPCFLWIFAFGPFVEALTSRPRLTAALSGIKAAVVGVIANLGFWFALHFFFTGLSPLRLGFANPLWPDATTLDARAVVAAALAAAMLFGLRWSVLAVVIASAGAGGLIAAIALP
jgi:chromate transporter